MSDVLDKINGKDYDFLRTNPDLSNIAYLTLSGSRGYGTNNENSDIDLRGFLVEDKKYIYGLENFEQFEELETDTVIYGLKKFVRLCLDANPNTLELLGTNEDCIIAMSKDGALIRNNSDIFLSKRVINSFGNYATAQLRRLQNALCHDSYDEQRQTVHLKNSLEAQITHFNMMYKDFDKSSIKIVLDEKNIMTLDIDLKNYPIDNFNKIYSQMQNTVKTYNKLNHRNRKKDDAHLYKHAMHLIRLLITGKDILDGKGIVTFREEEHEFLMNLRNGEYTFDEIFEYTNVYQNDFEKSAMNTKLPDQPNYKKAEEMMFDIYNS